MDVNAAIIDQRLSAVSEEIRDRARELVERQGEHYFNQGVIDVDNALKMLYCEPDISLQQLSATFRRGDLIEKLDRLDSHHMN